MNPTKAITKIEAMYKHFGKKEGFKCGDCCNLIKKEENRTYYKCKVYGCSASIATDWVKKWTACGMFDIEVEQNEHRALSIRQEVEDSIDGQIKIEEIKKMKKYKVLKVIGNSIYSPLQNYYYGKIKEVIGKKFICDDFSKSKRECDKGFYATDIDGLIYCMNNSKSNRIFEVEVGGRSKVFNEYKQRYEEQTIVRMLSENEVRELIREQSDKMDWDYYHACYPVNPLELDIPFNKDKALKLLKEWASVWESVWYSVGYSVEASVRDSVGYSVWASVWASVWDSVYDSVWASVQVYISSLFPNIKKWKYIKHKEGVNPFQSGIDLWHMGLVPSFDGKVWRLHKGKKAEVVLEISEEELER